MLGGNNVLECRMYWHLVDLSLPASSAPLAVFAQATTRTTSQIFAFLATHRRNGLPTDPAFPEGRCSYSHGPRLVRVI